MPLFAVLMNFFLDDPQLAPFQVLVFLNDVGDGKNQFADRVVSID